MDYFKTPTKDGFIAKPSFLQFCAIISGAYDVSAHSFSKGNFPNKFAENAVNSVKMLKMPYLYEVIEPIRKTLFDFGLVCGIDYEIHYSCTAKECIFVSILQHLDTVPTNKSLCFGSFSVTLDDFNEAIELYPYFNN